MMAKCVMLPLIVAVFFSMACTVQAAPAAKRSAADELLSLLRDHLNPSNTDDAAKKAAVVELEQRNDDDKIDQVAEKDHDAQDLHNLAAAPIEIAKKNDDTPAEGGTEELENVIEKTEQELLVLELRDLLNMLAKKGSGQHPPSGGKR